MLACGFDSCHTHQRIIMLDKSIKHGKEKRKQYRRSKLFDRSCRNHGSCSYCRENRIFNNHRRELISKEAIEDHWLDEWDYYHGGYHQWYTWKYDKHADIAKLN